MEAWKKAQKEYNNQKVRIQINDWTIREFDNFEEYSKFLNPKGV